MRTWPSRTRYHVSTFSSRDLPECSASAATPASRSAFTWSSIKATSGDTTIAVPGRTKAGTWKQSDLPAPVGMTASAEVPAIKVSTTSS